MCHGKKVYNYKSWNSHHHEHLPINFSSWQKGIPLKMDCGLPSSKLKWLWKIYRTSPVKNISKLRVAKKGQHRPPMAAKTRVKLPSSIGLGWPLPCAMRVKVISASSAFTEPRMVTGWMDGWHCDASFDHFSCFYGPKIEFTCFLGPQMFLRWFLTLNQVDPTR